jgi:hypothetical protein
MVINWVRAWAKRLKKGSRQRQLPKRPSYRPRLEALEQNRKRPDSLDRRQAAANTLGWLALLLKKQSDAAEPLAREAVAFFEKELPNDQRRFYWVSLLGKVLCSQQKYAEAEPLLLEGYEGMKQREAILPANEKRRLAEACERVVRFYEMTIQPEKGREWRDRLGPVSTK